MSRIELDSAGAKCNLSAIEKYYENNLSSIVRLESPSPSNKTVSSTNSIVNDVALRDDHGDSSTTASDSELEELELDSVPARDRFLRYHNEHRDQTAENNSFPNDGNVIVVGSSDNNIAQASGPQINTVAIQNSSDIQFGNKKIYNGPVTIKQFLFDDKNNKWIRSNPENGQLENGVSNKGFDGSLNNVEVSQNTNTNQPETKPTNTSDVFKFKNFTFRRKNVILTAFTAVCAFAAIVILTGFLIYGGRLRQQPNLGDGDDSRKNIAINSTIGGDLLLGKVLRLISRDEWLAQPPNNDLTDLVLPVKRYIITHTATESCETQAACTLRVRLIQTYHMESKNWDDIGYNFLVGGDGAVYEARGWDKQGAHTKGFNSGSIGIAYIGTFNKKLPSEKQLLAGFLLMNEGVKEKKVVPDYKIYAHRQLIASESPGATFFELIKKWDHWSNDAPEVV